MSKSRAISGTQYTAELVKRHEEFAASLMIVEKKRSIR